LFSNEFVVERAIRAFGSSETTSVTSAKWFRKGKSNIPSSVGLAEIEDVSASIEFFWTGLLKSMKEAKSRSKDSEIEMGVGMRPGTTLPEMILPKECFELLDFSLLPKFETVRKYFGIAAIYGISRPDGFYFESKYLSSETAD
jgi:hypothetical protein